MNTSPLDSGVWGVVTTFLCGAPTSYLTGTAIHCDGGLVRSF